MHRITLLTLVTLLALAAAALLTTPSRAAAQQTVVFDEYLTPVTGALNLITLQRGLASLEDHFLPLKLGTERTRLGLAAGILYRAAKFTALDVPQDHMFLVVQHEFFGHGARLRELGERLLLRTTRKLTVTDFGFAVLVPMNASTAK